MSSVLKEKVAGMTDQQAAKLAREFQEIVGELPAVRVGKFPMLTWLFRQLKQNASIDEQVHRCSACSRNLHLGHSHTYSDTDGKIWTCKCTECTEE